MKDRLDPDPDKQVLSALRTAKKTRRFMDDQAVIGATRLVREAIAGIESPKARGYTTLDGLGVADLQKVLGTLGESGDGQAMDGLLQIRTRLGKRSANALVGRLATTVFWGDETVEKSRKRFSY